MATNSLSLKEIDFDITSEEESIDTDDLITESDQTSEGSESEEEEQIITQEEKDETEKMLFLMSHFSKEQLDRYERYRRSTFSKTRIKSVIENITDCSVSQDVAIAMAGIAKLFVCDIIEESLDIQQERGEKGPLHPKQIREARRQFRRQGKM